MDDEKKRKLREELEDELSASEFTGADHNPKPAKKAAKKKEKAMSTEKKEKKVKKGQKDKKGKKAKKGKKDESSRISKSGKYTSLRNLMETLFAKKKDAGLDEVTKTVKAEYPGCSFLSGGRTQKRFGWYKSHIVGHGEFNTISAPAWTKGAKAKVKTSTKKK